MIEQIPLAFRIRPGMSFDNFVAGSNEQVLQSLKQSLEPNGEPQLFIAGGGASGKTHLLTALCALAQEKHLAAAYLPLRELRELSPDLLENLEQMDLIAFDDIEAIAGLHEWEEALFALFNRAREKSCRLIFTADCGPATLPVKLADLRSRLSWGVSFQLSSTGDDEKIALLIQQANNRGMELAPEVARYLLNHCARDTSSLLSVLNHLDQASLAAKRRLTLPFVREQLRNFHA